MPVGRFAPSPTGELHVGNLRTALIAWRCARSARSRFVLRFEDLDRVTARHEHVTTQLRDLEAIGIDWDASLIQSTRFEAHHEAIAQLIEGGHTFECFCTRREIAEAAQAPNGSSDSRVYPGTCRELSNHQRSSRLAAGRPPALRLRGHGEARVVEDRFAGRKQFVVDDVVLRRNDGVPAYNLAVVVDDAFQGIEEVVRADDLLPSAAPQQAIADLLNLPPVSYVHVPLVVNVNGDRLAKRDGAVTLRDLAANGISPRRVREMLDQSIGIKETGAFALEAISRQPWVFPNS